MCITEGCQWQLSGSCGRLRWSGGPGGQYRHVTRAALSTSWSARATPRSVFRGESSLERTVRCPHRPAERPVTGLMCWSGAGVTGLDIAVVDHSTKYLTLYGVGMYMYLQDVQLLKTQAVVSGYFSNCISADRFHNQTWILFC